MTEGAEDSTEVAAGVGVDSAEEEGTRHSNSSGMTEHRVLECNKDLMYPLRVVL